MFASIIDCDVFNLARTSLCVCVCLSWEKKILTLKLILLDRIFAYCMLGYIPQAVNSIPNSHFYVVRPLLAVWKYPPSHTNRTTIYSDIWCLSVVYIVRLWDCRPLLSGISCQFLHTSLAPYEFFQPEFIFFIRSNGITNKPYTRPPHRNRQRNKQHSERKQNKTEKKLLNTFWLNYFVRLFWGRKSAGNAIFTANIPSIERARERVCVCEWVEARLWIYPLRDAKPIDWLLPIQTSCHS